MSDFSAWLAATPVPEREHKAWVYERALHSILQLSGCTIARALAAAALANDREHQHALAATEIEGIPV